MIRIVRLVNLGGCCPTQWEGKTDDDREVYIRYRHGCLRVEVAGETVFSDDDGSTYGGSMLLDELKARTKDALEIDVNDDGKEVA